MTATIVLYAPGATESELDHGVEVAKPSWNPTESRRKRLSEVKRNEPAATHPARRRRSKRTWSGPGSATTLRAGPTSLLAWRVPVARRSIVCLRSWSILGRIDLAAPCHSPSDISASSCGSCSSSGVKSKRTSTPMASAIRWTLAMLRLRFLRSTLLM
jgi:hypothetical protein